MVDLTSMATTIVFEVEGWDKFWALRSRLEIPLSHIKGARVDDDAAKGWWHGVKVGGADLPGRHHGRRVLQEGRFVFYDTHKPEHTIVVDLEHETYDALILQVRDPAGAVQLISDATKQPRLTMAAHLADPDHNSSFTKGVFLGEIRESLVFPFPELTKG